MIWGALPKASRAHAESVEPLTASPAAVGMAAKTRLLN
jgi:hypothetical protein